MKRALFLLIASVLTGLASAQTHTGVGVCLTTSPKLPNVAAACLFEIGARCTLEWNQVDSMTTRAHIEATTCTSAKQ